MAACCSTHTYIFPRVLIAVKGIPFVMLDGASPEHREIRSTLFELSGKQAYYPQVFLEKPEGGYSYVGDWDDIHHMNELNETNKAFDNAFQSIPRVAPGSALAGYSGHGFFASSSSVTTPTGTATGSSSSATTPWRSCTDDAGDVFWWNSETEETSWVDPRTAVADGSGEKLWIPQIDDKQRTYYYNFRSGDTRWSLE